LVDGTNLSSYYTYNYKDLHSEILKSTVKKSLLDKKEVVFM